MASTLLRFSPAIFDTIMKSLLSDGGNEQESAIDTLQPARVATQDVRGDHVQPGGHEAIKDSVEGATINDVVLAICAGALRLYLEHHDELPDDPLVAIAPVNARSSRRDAEAPGNNISAMSVALPTNVEIRWSVCRSSGTRPADQGGQVRDIGAPDDRSDQACAGRDHGRRRAAGRRRPVHIQAVQPVHLQCPGPQQPLYMNGAKLLHTFGLAPLADGMGLFIATPSYNGEMTFSIISAREIMPDIEFFRECLRRQYPFQAAE